MNDASVSALAPPADTPRVAVIGGGITGLAAAHRLVELLPHARLTLYEAGGRLGGVIETLRRDQFLVERSADSFLTKMPWAVDLCRRVGLAADLLPSNEAQRRALVVRNGELVPIPEAFYLMSPRRLWPLLRSPVLSPLGKLRLLVEPLVGRGGGGPRNRDLTSAESDESVASFARRRLGREAFERLVQPLVAGIYTADPEKLSVAAALPEFVEYERRFGSLLRATLRRRADENQDDSVGPVEGSGARYGQFLAPREGLGSLIEALARQLPSGVIRCGVRVTHIRRQPPGPWNVANSTGGYETFDGVIVALPAYAAAECLAPQDEALASELGAIPYAGCVVVSCTFHRRQIGRSLDGFGFVVPTIERRRIIAASFASEKFAGRAPPEDVLIRVFVGGALQPELTELDDAALASLAGDELGDLLQISGDPIWVDVARWPRSMPQYHVGHLARVDRIERLAATHAGLELAGSGYRGVGIPQCILSGQLAAERLASRHPARG